MNVTYNRSWGIESTTAIGDSKESDEMKASQWYLDLVWGQSSWAGAQDFVTHIESSKPDTEE